MAITPIYNPAPDDPTADTLYQTGNKINNNEAYLDSKIDDEITDRTNAVALKADIASPAFTGNPTAPTPSVGDDDTSIATTAFVQNELALKPNRNLIINGDFSVWQRSTSASITSAGYVYNSADRWQFYYADTTVTKSVQIYDGTKVNAMQVAYSGSGAGVTTVQYIENGSSVISGQNVTVSFVAAATSGLTGYRVQLTLYDDSGTARYNSTQSITLTSSSAKYEVTFAVSDISAFDITAGKATLTIDSLTTVGASTLLISNVQLEVGSKATAFEHVPYQTQLARCQRYYQKSYTMTQYAGTITTAGAVFNVQSLGFLRHYISFQAMRAAPTVVIYSTASGVAGNVSENGVDIAATAVYIADSGCTVYGSISGGLTVSFHYTADAEIQ